MTAESSKNNENSSEYEQAAAPETAPACGPGCACGEPVNKGYTKLKIAVCLAVIVAVAGILVYKTTSARQNPSAAGTNGFSISREGEGPVTNSSGQKGGSGAPISAIAELNSVAGKLHTVFLVISDKDNTPLGRETSVVLASVERTLNAKGLSTGIFTLKSTSPDYPAVAAKVTPPGIAVLSKGGGIGFVSGEVAESSLMQAYVASTRTGAVGRVDVRHPLMVRLLSRASDQVTCA